MKNFEKYEKEIKEKLTDKYKGLKCLEGITGKNFEWTYDVIMWLYEDYKEPLLTEEERKYLKAIIEPIRDKVKFIIKDEYELYIDLGGYRDITIPTNEEFCKAIVFDFKKLKNHHVYSLEDLGL